MLRLGGKGKRPVQSAGGGRSPAEIRLQQEFDRLDLPGGCDLTFPNADDLRHFNFRITPASGFWNGATYLFSFDIPVEYPFETPKVKCQTKIFHPNIDVEGNICLNILRDDWSPVLSFDAIIFGLILLLEEPNPHDPLNHEAAAQLRSDADEFAKIVNRTLRGSSHNGVCYPRLL